MRTPLASLQLHANLLKTSAPDAFPGILHQLDKDAQRSAAVIHHLLALARASRTQLAEDAASFNLAELVRQIAADYGEKAYKSRHELCVSAPDAVILRGYRTLLEIAIRNLVENSLAHTPAGTLVEVLVQADPVSVEVRDILRSGPQGASARGILGLGLGHQVVQKVAAIHGADFVKMSYPDGAAGYKMGPLRDIGHSDGQADAVV